MENVPAERRTRYDGTVSVAVIAVRQRTNNEANSCFRISITQPEDVITRCRSERLKGHANASEMTLE